MGRKITDVKVGQFVRTGGRWYVVDSRGSSAPDDTLWLMTTSGELEFVDSLFGKGRTGRGVEGWHVQDAVPAAFRASRLTETRARLQREATELMGRAHALDVFLQLGAGA